MYSVVRKRAEVNYMGSCVLHTKSYPTYITFVFVWEVKFYITSIFQLGSSLGLESEV